MSDTLTNRPTDEQAMRLRWIRDGGAPQGGQAEAACRRAGWFTLGGADREPRYVLTTRGRAAVEAARHPLTETERKALALLLGGPLFWSRGRRWTAAQERDATETLRISSGTALLLLGRGLVHVAKAPMVLAPIARLWISARGLDVPPIARLWISVLGLDALGVVAPRPLPEGVLYEEGSGPKLYAWPSHVPLAPGWRPGLAAPVATEHGPRGEEPT